MASFISESYYASNDETKGDSFDNRESYPSSLQSTPSDFDESIAEGYRKMNENQLYHEYISLLNEMNEDLVFEKFDLLKIVNFFLIAKLTIQNFDATQVNKFIDDLGRRMVQYSNRVCIEAIFLLTDLLRETSVDNKTAVSDLLISENILDAMRMLLSTTCHLTIRSVLNFTHQIAIYINGGFGKIKLCNKLTDKIAWVAAKKTPMNYLSRPAISENDRTVENRLKTHLSYFSVNGTHNLAIEIITLLNEKKK